VFYDTTQLKTSEVRSALDLPEYSLIDWPYEGVEYLGDGEDKWTNSQRHKMLAGFVHVPARYVLTPYWLKLDTDAVATGTDDWIDEKWFSESPGIVAQRWGYTKPVDQMRTLDDWADRHGVPGDSLKIKIEEGSSRLSHPRIASWCGFFSKFLTVVAAGYAEKHCGAGQIPVPSQDGYHWYMAQRLVYKTVRTNFKNRGWNVKGTTKGVTELVKQTMERAS